MSTDCKKVTDYRFFDRLCRLPFVDKIILYGSRARGDNQPRSDIDLAISAPNATIEDWREVLWSIEIADTLLGIDCVWLEDLDPESAFYKNIMEEGVELFSRSRDKHES